MKFSYPIILLMALACAASLPACNWADNQLHGYIEGQLTFLSSPNEGKLEQLLVHRGQQVKKDDFLFSLEQLPESAQLKSATAIINQANANLKDLLYGKRPTEIDAIKSQINVVKAKITFLSKDHERYKLLLEKSAVDRQKYDQTTQDLAISISNLKELQANLDTAKLPARADAIKAAEAALSSAQALFDKASWELSEKSVKAPDDAVVFDTYYKVGERVPANRPVLSLLRSRNIIAVFFIPEPQLANIHINQKITLTCDNCKTTYKATVRFISPIAEYTPPVIYSNSARSKLVYRVEANIFSANSPTLHPGQPIDILLEGTGR